MCPYLGVKTISLTQGKETLVDDETYETFGHLKWCVTNHGYAVRRSRLTDGRKKLVLLHRLVTLAREGDIVHHRNGIKLDNRSENLELISSLTDHVHLHMAGRTPIEGKYRGVYLLPTGRWRAMINCNRKCVHLGCFATAEEAARAWDAAAREYFGPNCYQNFPPDVPEE
jgi:HNH endonuclease